MTLSHHRPTATQTLKTHRHSAVAMAFTFNPDGSLAAGKKKAREHTSVLLALEEVPFGMGRKLLTDHLRGVRNARTAKLRLDRYLTHGDLGGYQPEELDKLYDFLERKGLVAVKKEKGIYPVLTLTEQGQEELENPQLEVNLNDLEEQAVAMDNPFPDSTEPSGKERQLMTALDEFFPRFNQEQRHAVVSQAENILCVAGAGSGKTSVLTRRIAFLHTYQSVEPQRILAITFTRKARREMQARLAKLIPGAPVQVETFNSYCEKALQKHGGKLYGQDVRMASFKEQLKVLLQTLKDHGHTQASIIDEYFTERQKNGKDSKTLFFTFAYDFRSLVDKIRITDTTTDELRRTIKSNRRHATLAKLLLDMADTYLEHMRSHGLRDYTDQVVDTVKLYRKHPETIPEYRHVLVDEYQDVNDLQIRLLKLLNPENLFVVGDPRQSIYGWRGSRLRHILDFPQQRGAAIIQLTTNYRSGQAIVTLCNEAIRNTGYEDLKAATQDEGVVTCRHVKNEDEQAIAIADTIRTYQGDRKDIFVLSRTNKGLEKLQQALQSRDIDYLLRTDELKRPGVEAKEGQVTLATVHAIKGLEAKKVYLINANTTNFPCKASDHPVMDLFQLQEDYDTYAEELRVLYVALSRARDELHITYTGNPSPFLPSSIYNKPRTTQKELGMRGADDAAALMKLRQWRYQEAKRHGVPAYVVCSDATLEALLQRRPQTVEELHAIPGLGEKRVSEHGEALLDALSTL